MKLEKIINIVNEEFGVNIRENKRNLQNMNALKTYVYLARENTYNNLAEIGKRVNRHHSSVIHHYNGDSNIVELMKYDEELAEKFNNCEVKVKDMKVKIKKIHPNAVVPFYAKQGDAGMDLTAVTKSYDNQGNVVYGTGLAFQIPSGYVGLLFPRSSNANKSLILSNSVGVLDSGYRGEVSFKFKRIKNKSSTENKYNEHTYEYQSDLEEEYNVGDRIGQIVIVKIPQISIEVVDELSETERGTGGYGSTGK